MIKKHYSNKDELNLAVITKLKANSKINQRDLAKQLNVSLGGLNYVLRALVNKGFVKVKNFKNSKNKLNYAYILTAEGIAEKILTKSFLFLNMQSLKTFKKKLNT